MIDAATRRLVRERAGNRCEYCGILQAERSPSLPHAEARLSFPLAAARRWSMS